MTYRTKNIALILGFLVVLILIYQTVISDTMVLHGKLENAKLLNSSSQNSTERLFELKHRASIADSIIIKSGFKNDNVQNNLLNTLNAMSEEFNYEITHFMEPHISIQDGMARRSYQFEIKGSYKALMEAIYLLENKHVIGQFLHVSFKKEHNYRRNSDYLECTGIIQNVTSQ